VTDNTGNTIKVTTSPASRITKTDTAAVTDIHPGDVVIIQGAKAADGSTAATTITLGGGTFGGAGAAAGGAGG
jgi:hypothetical protein